MNASSYTSSNNSSSSSSARQSPTVLVPVPQPAPPQVKQSSTEGYLKDLNLVAEAAKRAQMAVLVRDFEDCSF